MCLLFPHKGQQFTVFVEDAGVGCFTIGDWTLVETDGGGAGNSID